jgi:DNA invertase Pin-like site-specific DNA recombinase
MSVQEYKIGYARVSTNSQDSERQTKALKEAGCDEIIIDHAQSGATNHKSAKFHAMLARTKEFSEEGFQVVVVVKSLDRFSRSTQDLLASLETLVDLGADFLTLEGGFTYRKDNPQDKLILTVLGGIAEFERQIIQGRTSEGRQLAVDRGLRLGPKPKLNDAKVRKIRKEYEQGSSLSELASDWEVSKSTIQRVLGLYDTPAYISLDTWQRAKDKATRKAVPRP